MINVAAHYDWNVAEYTIENTKTCVVSARYDLNDVIIDTKYVSVAARYFINEIQVRDVIKYRHGDVIFKYKNTNAASA